MEVHVLDIIMYFVIGILIMIALPQQCKEELGAVIGLCIFIVYTILYIATFAIVDYNWSEIFNSKHSWFDIKW
jgi:hypothetical protein